MKRQKNVQEKVLRNYFKRGPRRRISDDEVDICLEKGLQRVKEAALSKLNVLPEEVKAFDPLVIQAPVLLPQFDVEKKDIVFRVGKDLVVRFGIYKILVIHLSDHHLGAYECDYNLLRDVILNECTEEFHYQDIVSVSSREVSTSLKLATGKKARHYQEFSVSVSSGESISAIVSLDLLDDMAKKHKLPETGVERAVNRIRAALREKKAGMLRNLEE